MSQTVEPAFNLGSDHGRERRVLGMRFYFSRFLKRCLTVRVQQNLGSPADTFDIGVVFLPRHNSAPQI